MPGLSQLKQFNIDILNLGDEVKIRSARGEKPSLIPIPNTIEDKDDSEDFVLGMPQISDEELEQADAAAAEQAKEANDFSDILGNKDTDTPVQSQTTSAKLPDVSDLLTPTAVEDLGDLDLSDFEEPQEVRKPEKPKEIPIEDLDLDALLAPSKKVEPEQTSAPQQEIPIPQQEESPLKQKQPQEPEKSEPEFPPELQAIFNQSKQSPVEPTNVTPTQTNKTQESKTSPNNQTLSNDIPSDNDLSLEPLESLESLDGENLDTTQQSVSDQLNPETVTNSENTETEAQPESTTETDDFSDDFTFDGSEIDLNEGLPEELDEQPEINKIPPKEEEPENTSLPPDETSEVPDINIDEIGNPPEALLNGQLADDPIKEETTDNAFDTSALDNLPDFNIDGTNQETFDIPDMDFSQDKDLNVPSDTDLPQDSTTTEPNSSSETNETNETDFSTDDFSQVKPDESTFTAPSPDEIPTEKFDTSEINDMDFSSDQSDFELGNISALEDDTFTIPGFSDTDTAEINNRIPSVSVPDFSNAKTNNVKQKNTFTDSEYEIFKKNLADYPLNVRIALEDFVVKNEFTDEAVFGLLEKVLRKAPARQLASELEKILDISLNVPRDYERRTAEEYEAYKQSVEYQLKNRIIPGAILTTAAAVIIFCIGIIFRSLIFIPIVANKTYKTGYECLERGEYPQSEAEFDKAITFKPIKKWFYTYAQGYRKHKQYDRSVMMYKAILQRFNKDKQAGLEWADMELYDRFNYSEAERILKREVLDFHINDPDATLLLGDDYLEWATEQDPTKFELAKEQYSLLVQLYERDKQNLYLSRMMRYFIRTDNLREVLQYKEHFMPLKKALDSKDLTELSGYLLDKRYGQLKPSEENLRFNIEDVRELLERAVKSNTDNPIALYNMGRYFVETQSGKSAKVYFTSAMDAFGKQTVRNKRDTYKYINTYRLLGEQYSNDRNYILAEQTYNDGITLFENENKSSGLTGDKNVGQMYSDLADISYFISGDMDSALLNYQNSVLNKNDTSSVRYRIGYIQYCNQNYSDALGSFIRSSDTESEDPHLLLALSNTLSIRNDNYAAQGYYNKLISILNQQRKLHNVLLPQIREDQADIVETYMKASNNLGVVLHKIALSTGNSKLNAQAIVSLSESMRAWDALTRNQETMVRLGGSNLPEMNIKYITHPVSSYKPEIFTEIPHTLTGEKELN